MMHASKNSLLLLCMLAFAVLCGVDAGSSSSSTGSSSQGNGNVFQGVMDSLKNAWNKVEGKVETTFSYDLNKDGQVGEFRSQEDAIDTRQVGGDPNAAGRFQMSRPRTGRMLQTEGDKAAPAPRLRK